MREVPSIFWQEMMKSKQPPLLLCDYDGTLAPFTSERDKAFPWPGVIEELRTVIAISGIVVLISGRSIAEVKELSQLETGIEIWGYHGAERMTVDGIIHRINLAPLYEAGLEKAWQKAMEESLQTWIERKYVSLALHWRGRNIALYQDKLKKIMEYWSKLQVEYGLKILSFNGGVEILAPGFDKGKAVKTILSAYPDSICAYLGDDATDEDAFAVLQKRCMGILVSDEDRQTLADVRLVPPCEVLSFFRCWKRCLQEKRGEMNHD